MIPYGRQEITREDIEAVVEVLRSDFITQGPLVPRFEQAVADYCGAEYGVAANSGTSALHIACQALGVTTGDRVWTTPNTFVASANCARYCGAQIDFVDIDTDTFNLSSDGLAAKLEVAERDGKLPKVVIPVHFGGLPCDLAAIYELAQRYDFAVIEDASHAIGARYRGGVIGNCRYSDVTVFSFHPVKLITTAEGGMAMTNHADLAERMRRLSSHGITRDTTLMTNEPDGPWYYQQIELGYNYRMTEMSAALGLSQLVRLDNYIKTRRQLAERYNQAFSGLPITTQREPRESYSSYHLYVARVPSERHRTIFEHLRHYGIGVNVHYIPVHLQPDYQKFGFKEDDFPAAEEYYSEAITLPLFPSLRESEQTRIISAIMELFA